MRSGRLVATRHSPWNLRLPTCRISERDYLMLQKLHGHISISRSRYPSTCQTPAKQTRQSCRYGNNKVKFTLQHTMKAENRWVIDLLFLNLAARWGRAWSAPRPGNFTHGTYPTPTPQEAGWPHGRSGRQRKISLRNRIRTLNPAVSRFTKRNAMATSP